MAVYHGFFDAALNEDTNEYDRAYDSGDFTGYFEQLIGSGVCVYNNPDSMLVRFQDGSAVVAPGYLFIQGYWLKNDGAYVLPLPGAGVYAVAAHLNLGRRMIEMISQQKAEPGKDPDSLVLAYVTVDAAGEGTVEDTRYNVALCGAIDAMGSLSSKVEYAVDYIDHEIDTKLAQAEADIEAQSLLLDAKIAQVSAEVDKLAPPPIGAVKFSASQNVGPEWLRCDGSFVSEADYPELVAALGKHSPGAEEFKEVSGGKYSGTFSTSYLYGGYVWVFWLERNQLLGFPVGAGDVKEISVTGTELLQASASNPIVLSICEDTIFIAQNQIATTALILLEAKNFSADANALSCSMLDLMEPISRYSKPSGLTLKGGIPGENFVPEVVKVRNYNFGTDSNPDVSDAFKVCVGTFGLFAVGNLAEYQLNVGSIIWKSEDFSSATVLTDKAGMINGSNLYPHYIKKYADTLRRYSRKCSNEMLLVYYYGYTNSSSTPPYAGKCSTNPISIPLGLFSGATEVEGVGEFYQYEALLVSPVAGDNVFINRCTIEDGKLVLRAGTYNPTTSYGTNAASSQTLNIALPSYAKLFQDSIEYSASQGLWMIFLGSGIAFSKSPLDLNAWGYLDMSKVLGVITQFGCIEFDEENQILCITGRDTANKLRVGLLRFPNIYDYANDGAWLPMIASDGVPAYIKAKEPSEGGG